MTTGDPSNIYNALANQAALPPQSAVHQAINSGYGQANLQNQLSQLGAQNTLYGMGGTLPPGQWVTGTLAATNTTTFSNGIFVTPTPPKMLTQAVFPTLKEAVDASQTFYPLFVVEDKRIRITIEPVQAYVASAPNPYPQPEYQLTIYEAQ